MYGTAIYRSQGGAWQEGGPRRFHAASRAGAGDDFSAPFARTASGRATGNGTHLARRDHARGRSDHRRRTFALARHDPGAADRPGPAVMRSPPAPSTGSMYGSCRRCSPRSPWGSTFQPLLTEGSVENLRLLHRDEVSLGLAQADIAGQALAGQGSFASQGAFPELRALGSLYPKLLHIIVRADSPAQTMRDLMHKRISLGPAGSAAGPPRNVCSVPTECRADRTSRWTNYHSFPP